MSTVIKIVGQITLKALTDVKSTTYYYLLQSSIAPAPTKPITNPPTGGWSTTEPGFFSYVPTQDATIVSNKDYYTRSGTGTEQDPYVYTKVTTPVAADINTYYEKIYGDTKSLYVTVQTLYTDNTFEYSEPSLSSSYEAAKEAYNRAKTALDLAGDTNQYFWTLSSAYSTNVPAGVYVTHIPQNQFKPSPAQGNVLVQNTGLTIRNGAVALASLTGSALNFYSPTTHNAAMQLSGQALNFYNPNNDRLSLSLNSNGLNFYGSSIVNPDASLTTTGLVLSKGGIQTGTSGQNGFVYLSSEDYQRKDATHNGITINGHTPTAAGTDDKTIDDPAWREIIGTKFGVDSEGNLYANNANLSNATVEGAITATSLTIGSGSDSYNAINAMNAAGYTIEIINDITAAPDNVVINDNSTYLYPIMYHNGIKVESVDIINTQYIWYRGSDTIGIQGDSDNGGMVADYGYTYRVAYSFDDGEVGQAPSVQQVLVDPSKYITRISDIGITIHPEDTSENNYLQIDGNGITIYKNTDSVAQFGTTARIGRINNSRFLINDNSLQAYSGTDITPYFEVNSTGLSWGNNTAATTVQVNNAAQTATNFIKTDENGIKLQNSSDATDYLFIDSSKIALYRNNIEKLQLTDSLLRLGDTTDYINLDSNGMKIYKNNLLLANFGSNVTIGQSGEKNVYIDNNGINIRNGSTILATFHSSGAEIGKNSTTATIGFNQNRGTIKGKDLPGSSYGQYDITFGIEDTGWGSDYYNLVTGLRTWKAPSSTAECVSRSDFTVNNAGANFTILASHILYDSNGDELGINWPSINGATENDGCNGVLNLKIFSSIGGAFESEGIEIRTNSNAARTTKTTYIDCYGDYIRFNGTTIHSSDKRLKTHIDYLGQEAIDFISALQPASFIFKNQKATGFYAQEIEEVDPWNCFVTENDEGYKNLNYIGFIAPLVTYCQHLEKRIAELESQLEGGID